MRNFKLLTIILMLIISTNFFTAYAQDDASFMKGKVTIKPSAALVPNGQIKQVKQTYWKAVNYRIDGVYGLTDWLSVGGFISYNNARLSIVDYEGAQTDSLVASYSVLDSGKFIYGFTSNAHLLPVFFKREYLPVDLYAIASIGLISKIIPKNITNYQATSFYYSVGAGLEINFSKYFGLICEYNYDRKNFVEGVYADLSQELYTLPKYWGIIRAGFNIRF
jgi:hypothetical protein